VGKSDSSFPEGALHRMPRGKETQARLGQAMLDEAVDGVLG